MEIHTNIRLTQTYVNFITRKKTCFAIQNIGIINLHMFHTWTLNQPVQLKFAFSEFCALTCPIAVSVL